MGNLFVFLIGLIFGSFLNVLIWRLTSEDSSIPKWWAGRSICPNCRKPIVWYDNIPLISFILLNGRCRNCKKKISLRYPIVEAVTGIATLIIFWLSPTLPTYSTDFFVNFILMILVSYSLIGIFFADFAYGIIPDELIIVGGIASGILAALSGTLRENIIVGATASLIFFAIVLGTKFRGMGVGDVKLAFVIGLLLGWPLTGVAFWIAIVSGGVVSTILVALRRVKFFGTIVLGPFLIIGVLVSALWGQLLLKIVGF